MVAKNLISSERKHFKVLPLLSGLASQPKNKSNDDPVLSEDDYDFYGKILAVGIALFGISCILILLLVTWFG